MANENGEIAVKIDEDADINGKNANQSVSKDDDPYAYLERQDFSSEKFKIEIKNLPKIYGMNEIRKLLNNKLNLASTKVKTPKRNSPYIFVCFRNEESREKAIEVLKNYKWKGRLLVAIKAKPSPDPLVKKRKENFTNDDDGGKKRKIDDRSQEEKLKSSTIPLWNIPYEIQLQNKQQEAINLLKKFGQQLKRNNSELKQYLEQQEKLHNGLPCELLNIRYSDQYNNYRNKCAFTVGVDEETQQSTVGFRIGSYTNGITGVGRIETLQHIPESMKLIVKLFEDYVRSSNLDVFNFELHTGYFRQLTIRVTTTQEIMAIIGIHPQNLNDDELKQFKQSLIDYFTIGAGKDAKITSLYYQKIVKKHSGENPTEAEHLWGDTHICEKLLDLTFKISPEAFFQINIKAAEILYKSIIELAEFNQNTTILDVCCGTGTIGLCFAKKCNKVLGVELVPHAIEDAKSNAKLNQIENSEFFVGKAEETLSSICYHTNDDVVAIVDPPRAGLQQRAVIQLRKINKIKNLVYVSCNPDAALKNFIDLGRPISKTLHNEPFVPIKAVVIDMFPHTKHYELVISFKRMDAIV